MAQNQVPDSLPAGFREIWEALRVADDESPSRQVLARRLGISTHTVQRILVDGDVPDLAATTNTRVLRAWVRIITRLAHAFGRDGRAWVEAAGIRWDAGVGTLVEETLDKLTARRGALRPELERGGEALEPVPQVAGYEFPDEIAVSIAAGRLDLTVGRTRKPFLETYISRLVGAIDPDCRIRVTTEGEAEAFRRLAEGGPGAAVVVGVADTLIRRMIGLDFVALPGLVMRLSALCLRRRGLEAQPPFWYEAASLLGSRDNKYMVSGDGLAYGFLRGQCGIAEESLIMRDMRNPEEAADTLLRESSLWESSIHQERWVILVDDEQTCYAVRTALERREDVMRDYAVERLSGTPEDFPAYQMAIALPVHKREIRDLMRAATQLDLFGSAGGHTARLYAEMVATGFMERNLGNLLNPAISNGPHMLRDFRGADGLFRRVFCRELVGFLRERIDAALDSRGLFRTQEAVRAQAWYLAAQHAHNLVPLDWAEGLNRVSPRPALESEWGVLRVPAMHCLSCSASLLDEGHRGVSDRYCRICSDDSGELRPRAEVEEILAKWFEAWHGRISHDEALRQAGVFMDRMPAWCHN